MRLIREEKFRHRVGIMLSLVVPLVVAVILVPFRTTFANAASALIFVAIITVAAVLGNRLTGFFATVSSALWFDFFLTRPYDELTIHAESNIEIVIAVLVIGAMITELAVRNHQHLNASHASESFVTMLRDLTELVANAAPPAFITEQAIAMLSEVLTLRSCHFENAPSDPPLARLLANGEVEHVGFSWPVEEMGIPGPEAEIPVQWRGRWLGRFVIEPTPGHEVDLERRVVAVAIANVVAPSLDEQRRVV